MSVRQSSWCRARRSVALRCSSGPCVTTDHGAAVVSLDYTQHPSAPEVLKRCAAETAEQHDV